MKKYEAPILNRQTVTLGEFFMSGCGGDVTLDALQANEDAFEFIALNIEGAGNVVVGSVNISS